MTNTAPGYVKTNEGILPVDWKLVQLQDLVRVFRGASPRPKGDPKYYGGNIPRVLIEDVTRDGKYVYPCVDSLTEEGAKKSRLLPKGSVILSCSGTRVAIPGILGIPACIHDGFFGFDSYKDLKPEYLYYFFSLLHEKMQSSATTGGVFNNLTTQIMKEMKVQLPPQNEQAEIINILNIWDKAIDLKQKLIEQKKEQKKGLMQKLLTGEVRLPGYEGVLRKRKLKGCIEEVKTKNKNKQVDKVLSVTNSRGFIEQSEQFDRQIASKDLSSYKIVIKGQFAYNPSRINVGSIDLLSDFDIGLLSPMYVVFKTNNEAIYAEYLYQFVKSSLFFNQMGSLLEGSVRQSLSFGALELIKLFLPEISEQKAIAKVLNTLDKEIELLQKEFESLKKQKQGLMQLLLTGKVRVKV